LNLSGAHNGGLTVLAMTLVLQDVTSDIPAIFKNVRLSMCALSGYQLVFPDNLDMATFLMARYPSLYSGVWYQYLAI